MPRLPKITLPSFSKFFSSLAQHLTFVLVRIWFSTLRITVHGERPQSAIYAFWHEHIFAVVGALFGQDTAQNYTALVSGSSDGRRLQRLMRKLGFGIASGSSTDAGAMGFLGCRDALAAGRSVMITPDGPRGPAGLLKEGVVRLAMVSNRPIVPVHVVYRSAWRLNSWDRAWLPKPFSSVDVIFRPPQYMTGVSDHVFLRRQLHAH